MQARREREQPAEHVVAHADELLEVVEHEQRALRGQHVEQRLQRIAGRRPHLQHGVQRLDQIAARARGHQRDEADHVEARFAAGLRRLQRMRQLDREARLAAPRPRRAG